jgi:hypothetical protein
MSTDVEELVRDGMHRLAAAAEIPTGLTVRARRRVRHRRLAAICAIAGAAAISAAAVVGMAGAGTPGSTTSRVQATAYVIGRVQNVVSTLPATGVVVQTETTFSPAFPAITQWNYRHQVRAVQSGVMHVAGVPWAQGQVSWAAGTAMIRGRPSYVQADYRHHQWYPTSAFLVVPDACTGGLDVAEFNSVNWPGYLLQTLSCGKFKLAGHAWVDGRRTIKITGSMIEPHWWADLPHAEGRGALHVDATFYVDPATYLPLRVVWSNWSHAVPGGLLRGTVRQDFQVLPATPRNVAKATVTIPPGFHKVHGAPFGGPMFQFVG